MQSISSVSAARRISSRAWTSQRSRSGLLHGVSAPAAVMTTTSWTRAVPAAPAGHNSSVAVMMGASLPGTSLRWCSTATAKPSSSSSSTTAAAFEEQLSGVSRQVREVLEQLRANPTDGAAWNDLGVLLETGERVLAPDGEQVGRLECLHKAADYAWESSEVWSNIGLSLNPGETINVRESAISALGCHLRAVRLDPNSGAAWLNLAFALNPGQTVVVPDVGKVARLEALALAVGALERVGVTADDVREFNDAGSTSMDPVTMLVGAYAMAAGAMLAGHSAHDFGATPGRERKFLVPPGEHARERTALQCIERALELGGTLPSLVTMATNLMPNDGTITVQGTEYTRRALLMLLLEKNADDADGLVGIAEYLEDNGEVVEVDGAPHDKVQLLARALRADVANGPAWRQLAAVTSRRGASLSIGNGMKLRPLDCVARACLYGGQSNPIVWEEAAMELERGGEDRIEVGDHAYTADECRQMCRAMQGKDEPPEGVPSSSSSHGRGGGGSSSSSKTNIA